jgi:integrase
MFDFFKRKGTPNLMIEFQHLGQHVRRSSGTTSKTEARALEEKWRREIHDRVQHGKAPTITLGEACARYYSTTLKPGAKKAKLRRDLSNLKAIKEEFGADTPLIAITQSQVAKWRDEMVSEDGLEPASANRVYSVLRAIVNKARDEWRVDAPNWKLKELKIDNRRARFLGEAEDNALLVASPPHLRDFLTIAMDSGGRRGELTGLTWDKVRFGDDRAVLLLPAPETKSKKARAIPVTTRATDILKRLRKDYPESKYVFMYRRYGEVRKLGRLHAPFQTACRRTGITDFRIHDCRHHFASRLAQRGATLQEIKELLGHAKLDMTLRYAHLCRSNLDRAVALLA